MKTPKKGKAAEKLGTTAPPNGHLRPGSLTARSSGEIQRMDEVPSMITGIRFYPLSSNPVAKSAELGVDYDERDSREHDRQAREQQSHGLDLSAIFEKVTVADARRLAPEQNITLFALRLAMIEKSASGIGKLAFIWASTIILGGFAANINPVDFMVVAAILVTEGTRIFSRSRELEWQHLASKSDHSSLTYLREKRLNFLKSHGSRDRQKARSGTETREFEQPCPPNPADPDPRAKITVVVDNLGPICSHASYDDRTGEKKLTSECSWCCPATDEDKQTEEMRKKAMSADNYADMFSRSDMWLERARSSVHPNEAAAKSSTPDDEARTAQIEQKSSHSASAVDIKRTWSFQFVPVISGGFHSILSTKGVGSILYWVQLTSAIICLVLSCWRVFLQEFNPAEVQRKDTPVNLFTSLTIFYSLALAEALLFLLERGYWEYKMNYQQLIVQMNKQAELGDENVFVMKQFFSEVYKKCLDGSVIDGLNMDLVEYSQTLLQSDNECEQLGGVRVLRRIADRSDGFSEDALRRIGTAPGVIERLVEMLSWRSPHQHDIRLEAAALVCRALRNSKNCLRIAAVPGSMEGIVSLIKSPDRERPRSAKVAAHLSAVDHMALRLDGLRILVAQAKDQVSLSKIGETRGLVPILVSFIAVKDVRQFRDMEAAELKTFKMVLCLLAMLASARNVSGTVLRPVIARVVFAIPSMRDILEFGACQPQLRWMAIETLTNLALDDDIRQAIGSTGGVIRNLFTLYIQNLDGAGALFATAAERNVEKTVSKRAGDALTFLTVQNRSNCLRMMDLQDRDGTRTFIPALLDLLNQHREQTVCAAKILRSLMLFGSDSQQREIAMCCPRVMRLIMGSSSQKMQEAVLGLAPRVLAVLDEQIYDRIFENISRTALVDRLINNLEYDSQTSIRFPKIRRHSIECILALVSRDAAFFEEFMRDGLLEKALVQTMDNICEVENFVTFSGSEGLTRHDIAMEDLVNRSLAKLPHLVRQRRRGINVSYSHF